MAEFKEVLKIRKRMCDSMDQYCTNCPLERFDDCETPLIDEWDEYEKEIIQWAYGHHELQYPTWREWQDENFPDASIEANLCNFAKCNAVCPGSNCRDWPIPAEIAEKLHIPQKGAKE